MAQAATKQCELCTVNTGSLYCYECKHVLCISCKNIHSKIPSTKSHKIRDLSQIGELDFQSEVTCQSHNEPFTLFCKSVGCKRLICSSCVAADHNGHFFSRINEIVDGKREKTKLCISQIKQDVNEIKSTIEAMKTRHIQTLRNEAEQVITDVTTMAVAIQESVDKVKLIRINEIKDFFNLEEKELNDSLTKFDQLLQQHKNVCEQFENALDETHDISFFLTYKTCKKEMKEREAIPKYDGPKPIPGFDHYKFLEDLLDQIKHKYPQRTLTQGLPENHDKSNTESESDDNNIHPDLESSSDDNNDEDSDLSETHMVTIGNLPKNITTSELQEFLEDYGSVVDVTIEQNDLINGGRSQTSALVKFESEDDADNIIEQCPIQYKGRNKLIIEKGTSLPPTLRRKYSRNRFRGRRTRSAWNLGFP